MKDMSKFNYYRDFCHKYFNAVCGVINRYHYPAILTVLDKHYVSACTGTTVFPCNINIFLETIFDITSNHNEICSIIVVTITHELYHLEQIMNNDKFNSDKEYALFVECNVDQKAIEFVNRNKVFIESIFNFKLQDVNNWIGYDKPTKVEYNQYQSPVEFFIYHIATIFSTIEDKDIIHQLSNIFKNYSLVAICINDNDPIILQKDYKICFDSIKIYLYYIDNYCRHASYSTNISIKTSDDNTAALMVCKIFNIERDPFITSSLCW